MKNIFLCILASFLLCRSSNTDSFNKPIYENGFKIRIKYLNTKDIDCFSYTNKPYFIESIKLINGNGKPSSSDNFKVALKNNTGNDWEGVILVELEINNKNCTQ